jgi:hypothetical protein
MSRRVNLSDVMFVCQIREDRVPKCWCSRYARRVSLSFVPRRISRHPISDGKHSLAVLTLADETRLPDGEPRHTANPD